MFRKFDFYSVRLKSYFIYQYIVVNQFIIVITCMYSLDTDI